MGCAKMKKLLCHGLAVAMVVSLTATASDSSAAAKKAKPAKKTIKIEQGKSKKNVVKNKKKKAKYKFTASNKRIKVSASGKVKAVKVGTAKVTVKEKYKKKTKKIGTVKIIVTKKKTVKVTKTPVQTSKPTNQPTSTPSEKPQVTKVPIKTPEPVASEVYSNYFEDGDLKGFAPIGGKLEVSNSQNYTEGGMNSLLVKDRTSETDGAKLPISEYVIAGEHYQFSVVVKQDTGKSQKVALRMTYTDQNGMARDVTLITNADAGKTCISGKWTTLKGEITIPKNQGDVAMTLTMTTATDSFLVDDVIISGKAQNDVYKVTDAQYEEMLENSVYSTGNNARIKKVIKNARDGKDVTLAYIGGSITEGALAKPNSMCYAEVSAKTFGAKYGKNNGENVHFINAGMSGTPSDIGVVRYNRDVIDRLPEGSDHPDVLFIEFAVNDYGTATAGKGYEGLIRQALKSGSAVVLVFSVFQKASGGVVCENNYRPFGTHYDLPMISMGNAISSYFGGNDQKAFYKWYFGDSLHPNNTGYQLMADCITRMFDKMDKETAEEDNITDMDAMAPVKSSAYQGMKMLDSKTDVTKDNAITSFSSGGFNQNDNATGSFQYEYKGQKGAAWFPDNWMHTSTSGTDALKLKVKCKALTLIYKLSNSKEYGSADLYVDGKLQATLSGYDTSGWNNGKVYVAIEEDAEAEHTIELRMNDESESKKFTLMAIGYN